MIEKAVLLGAEHDESLRAALRSVLLRLGATGIAADWTLAGSQERETFVVRVGRERIVIESETYVGLSIRGPADLVDQVQLLVSAAAERSSR